MLTTTRMRSRLATLTLAGALAACGGDATGPESPPAPDPTPNLAGDWSGSIVDYRDGSAGHLLEFELQQQGSTVTGVMASPMIRRTRRIPVPVEGRVNADGDFEFTAKAVDLNGCYDITATMTLDTRDDTLQGEYSVTRTGDGCGRIAIGRTRALGVVRTGR